MKIRKTLAGLVATLLLTMPASAKTLEFTIGSNDMYTGGKTVEKTVLDCAPYISNDRTLVPVRVISENFGAEVAWDDVEKRVDIISENKKISLYIGSSDAEVNGEKVTLDVAPEITDDRTMVPLRFISEVLGKRVEYVEASRQVIISDSEYAISVDDFNISIDDIRYYAASADILGNEVLFLINFPVLKDLLVKDIALSSEAKKNGVKPDADKRAMEKDAVLKNKEKINAAGALCAPGVKISNDILYGTEYIGGMNLTRESEYVQKLYRENFIRLKHILLITFDPLFMKTFDEPKKAEIKAKIDGILSELKDGADFDTLHKQYNEDTEAFFYPDGMTIYKAGIIKSIGDAAFELEVDEISGIVESDIGYHIIKRLSLPELDEKQFESVKNDIVGFVKHIKTEEAIANANIVYHMSDDEIVAKVFED